MKQRIKVFLQSKKFKKISIYFISTIIFLLILFFLFRNLFLHDIIEKKIEAFNKEFPAKLIIEDAYFTGITGIEFKGVKIIPEKKDTLFFANSVYAKLKLFPLLIGKIKLADLEITNTHINLVKEDTADNFSFLLSKSKNPEKIQKETNYASHMDRIAAAVFDKVPEKFSLKDFNLNVSLDNNKMSLLIKNIQLRNNIFSAPIFISERNKKEIMIAEGNINKSKRTLAIKLYSENSKFTMPLVEKKWNLLFAFDTLKFNVSDNIFKNECFLLKGYASINGLLINHKKISVNDVKLDTASFYYNFKLGKDYIELDSSSSLTYNKLTLTPYILFKKADAKQITFALHNEFSAQDFFSSLPSGLFTNFEKMITTGKLKLDIDFFVDMKQPDSLKFNINLAGRDFRVTHYGVTDFAMINEPFTFTAYEKGKPVKSFQVGNENPEFMPLDDISTYLKEAVLVSENGGYYFASGFDVNSLKLSIIENIKKKKFVRGGSTIEMQLVKNVFLTKNKTIARKIEELIIVWLIQTGNLCSKDRMYEVYLNVAEWGPGVYGIYEAAEYYFQKHPSKLTLSESIFLASILSHPKWFKFSFDKKGRLIPEQNQAYFNGIAGLLVEKAIIAQSDTLELLSKVKLKGKSLQYMAKDTANFKLDSLILIDE